MACLARQGRGRPGCRACQAGMPGFLSRRRSWDDFQRRDLVAFELEEETKVSGAAGEITGKPAGDDSLSILLFARERLARICVFSLCLPFLDGGQAVVGVALVLHDGVFSKTPSNGFAVTFASGE